jgi:hypothetical protein
MAELGREDLEMWEAWARGNSSRPGEFDLSYASPMESNAHPGALAVVEEEGVSRPPRRAGASPPRGGAPPGGGGRIQAHTHECLWSRPRVE